MRSSQRKRNRAGSTYLQDGVRALHKESEGLVRFVHIRPIDFAALLGEALAGHTPASTMLASAGDFVAEVTRRRRGDQPMLCAACPAELTGGFTVILGTANTDKPTVALTMGICTICAQDDASTDRAVLQSARDIWPDMRAINIHPATGHA